MIYHGDALSPLSPGRVSFVIRLTEVNPYPAEMKLSTITETAFSQLVGTGLSSADLMIEQRRV